MCGDTIFFEGERVGLIDEFAQVKIKENHRIACEIDRGLECDFHAIRISREVIGESAWRLVLSAKQTLKSQENVTALPTPVQRIQIWIQGMVCRIDRYIRGIGLGIRPDEKSKCLVGPLREVIYSR